MRVRMVSGLVGARAVAAGTAPRRERTRGRGRDLQERREILELRRGARQAIEPGAVGQVGARRIGLVLADFLGHLVERTDERERVVVGALPRLGWRGEQPCIVELAIELARGAETVAQDR